MPFWGTQETQNMRDERARGFWHAVALPAVTAAAMLSLASAAHAPGAAATRPPSVDIYGFGQADAIADFKQNDPAWFDTARPSRLPKFANQFGQDGHFYLS